MDLGAFVESFQLRNSFPAQRIELTIDQTDALVKFYEGRVEVREGREYATLMRESIIVFVLANMPNNEFLRPYSHPNMDYDGFQEISFKNLQSPAFVHSGINFRDHSLPLTMQLADDGKRYIVNFGNSLQFLHAPLVRAMNIINLESRHRSTRQNRRSQQRLERFPKIRNEHSRSYSLKPGLASTSHDFFRPCQPSGGRTPERCVAAHASQPTRALRLLRNTLEGLSLEIVEQHGCDRHKQEALDLSGFTNL